MADPTQLEELERRVREEPWSTAFGSLAEHHRRLGHFNEAIRYCRDGLTRHPTLLSARVTLAQALLASGAFDDAQEEFEAVLAVAPDNQTGVQGLAEVRRRRTEQPRRGQRPDESASSGVVARLERFLAAVRGARSSRQDPSGS